MDQGVGVRAGVPAGPADGVGVTESFAASCAVSGIPAMIQRTNTSTIPGLRVLFGGMVPISFLDGSFGSGMT